jgi:signal transduction histidine kinase/DNA-binding response OmpR family regulator/Tfp pilus assembly protein PilF
LSINSHKVRIFLSGICLAVGLNSFAQNAKIDSLELRLETADLGEQEKVDIMNALSFQYHRTDISKAFRYARKALALASQAGYKKGEGDSYHSLGVNLWEKGVLDSALISYDKAILIYDDLGLGEKGVRTRLNKAIIIENKDDLPGAIAQYESVLEKNKIHNVENLAEIVAFNMGIIYNKMGDWVTAIERYMELIRHAQKKGNKSWEVSAWQSIGNAYMKLEDTENAFQAFRSSLNIASDAGNRRQEADARRGLGRVYLLNNELDSAHYYFQAALDIQRNLNRNSGMALNLKSLGEISSKQQRYKEALNYQTQVLAIYKEMQRRNAIGFALVRIGETYLSMREIESAEKYLIEGAGMLDGLDGLILSNELLAKLYEIEGDYAKAFVHQKSYSIYKDSLLSDTKMKELGQLEAKYAYDREKQQLIFEQDKERLRQEQERLRLEKEKEVINTQLLATGAGVLLLFISIGFIVKAYREKSRANQKLQQLDQFKTRLFANINHDLRTPLTLIQGYIHRITSNKEDYLSHQSKEDLENLGSNAMTLTEMTNEIQDLILLEEGKLELKLQKVEIGSYLKRQVLMFGSMAEMAGISLAFESEVTGLFVNLDSRHVEKILFNLLSNAFRFTPAEGRIVVTLKEENERVHIVVSDTGIGIDIKDLPNIFDRFYQSPLNEYRSKEGFGIGLAVVNELVGLHGGKIAVTSEIDKGTTFSISLPFNLDKALSSEELGHPSDSIKTLPTKKAKAHMVADGTAVRSTVLIVDDHEEIRQYIIDLIAGEYEVKEAANGKQALEVLKLNNVDLILTDLMMPWLDGYDLIEQLKESETLRKVPLMVVSARTTEEDKHRVLDAGVNEFISKPFDPLMLQKRIRNLLTDQTKHRNTWEAIIADENLQSNLEGNILKKLNQIILDRISDANLNIDVIADELSASRSKTNRLIKELTGKTPLEYVKTIRMDFVHQAIKSRKVKNASEAASSVGMSNATQFAAQYKRHYGTAPFPK